MSKRPASTGIVCPGCTSNFDAEIHIPFVGSCGDSVCAVCINEHKIKDCPECHIEGGFAWNQKNNLAIKFLTATAENGETDGKKAKRDIGEEVPAILDPKNRHFLSQIVNQLNPRSFVNLSCTCKSLHNYCFASKDVKITYEIYSLHFRYCRGRNLNYRLAEKEKDDKPSKCYYSWNNADYEYGFLSSTEGRNKLKNYPFIFKVETLQIDSSADIEFFESLRLFLAQFPVQTISNVGIWHIKDGNRFMNLLKEFDVRGVKLDMHDLPEDIHVEFQEYLLKKLNKFECDFNISEQLILDLSTPFLDVTVDIYWNTIKQLIKKWADSTSDIEWILYSPSKYDFEFEIDGVFEEILPFYHKGPVPSKRPIAFVKKNKARKFYILRTDGKVVYCSFKSTTELQFWTMDPSDYPPCLLPDGDESRSEYDSDEYTEDESESDDDDDDDDVLGSDNGSNGEPDD